MTMLDATMLDIIMPAFAAGLVVLSTHVPLGREVIRRGIIFIDLAVAQIAGLGVIIASQLGWDLHGLEAQIAAVSSALAGALIMRTVERFASQHLEAYIGVIFVLAATASILLLANNPHGSEHLRELLVGQILWVDWEQVYVAAMISLVVLLMWYGLRQRIGNSGFYVLFAVSITVSVQLVGVYLVFSSLILPALATVHYAGKRAMLLAVTVGVVGYLSGLLLSAVFDLPGGAVIVWCLAISALIIPVVLSGLLNLNSETGDH
jgi:zinc/manganese transport system permease protein